MEGELNDGVLDAGAFIYDRSTRQKLLITLLMGLLVKYRLFKSQILNSPFGRHSSTSYTSDSPLHHITPHMSFCFMVVQLHNVCFSSITQLCKLMCFIRVQIVRLCSCQLVRGCIFKDHLKCVSGRSQGFTACKESILP